MSLRFLHFEVATDEGGTPVVLGRGAMGVTYRAFDTNLRCPVALKVIAPELLADAIARTRFLREARTAAALRHPNVATVLFLGESGGEVFYAMEFVEGTTLQEEIKARGPIAPERAREIALQVTKALAAAHRLGLVHRDIKPANIMLANADGELVVKLIDFGLAKLVGGQFSGETLAAASASGFQGTPHFASPEQINNEELDIRSDIYSLGVTLFAALTGRAPFEGTLAQVLAKHLSLAPPLEVLGGAAAPFREVLERMLAKDPADRFQVPADLRAALEGLSGKLGGEGARFSAAAGSIVAGRYRLAGEVATLSHATIYKAEKLEGGAPAGIVMLGACGPGDLSRWEETIAKLRPIPSDSLIGVSKIETANSGLALVTEWVDGASLFELMKRRRALPQNEALAVLARVAKGLDAVEAAGLPVPPLSLGDILVSPKAAADAALDQVEGIRFSFLGAMPEEGSISGPDATLAPGSAAKIERSAAQTLAGIAYELFGGMRTDGSLRWTPLPALSANGNSSLRSALEDAGAFSGADELFTALQPGAKLPRRQRHRPSETRAAAGGESAPVASPRGAQPPPLPPRKAPKRRGLPWVPILGGAALVVVLAAAAFFLFPPKKAGAGKTDVVSVLPVNATPVPSSTPTPEPTPDPAAEYFAAAVAAQARDDFSAALANFAEAASRAADPAPAKEKMQMIAAFLDSDGFVMTGEKFAQLRPGIEAAAEKGVMAAQFLLGKRLIESEPDAALKWIGKAAAQDNTEAAIQYGLMLAYREDWPQAVTWLRIGANSGNPRAMTLLAECLMDGKGSPQSPAEAIKILSDAAAFNDPLAIAKLGVYKHKGIPGVLDANPAEAFQLLSRASDMGSSEAMANLGVFYINGIATQKNPQKAVQLWKESAASGDPIGMFFYGQALEAGLVGGVPNEAEANKYYLQSARKKNASAIQKCQQKGLPIN